MIIFDKKFITHRKHYILQTLIATLFAFTALIALGGYKHSEILGIVGFTSLGSSAFSAFAAHDTPVSSIRCMLGGYILGIITGIIFWQLAHIMITLYPHGHHYLLPEIFGALAIGITMFLMTILQFEHPPAAGLSLGLVLESWTLVTLFIILSLILLLILLKRILKPWLVNLS